MTPTQLLTCVLLLFGIILWQALYQAKRFKQNKPISHWGKATIYGVASVAIALVFLYGRWNNYYWYWQMPLLASFQRLALFDPILNWRRGMKFYYVGRGTTGSIQGKIEGQLSDTWVKVLKVVFVVCWLTIIYLIYKEVI